MVRDLVPMTRFLNLLQQIPYLASKNVYKVASHFLSMPPDNVEHFCKILLQVRSLLTSCSTCFYWKERDSECILCNDKTRDDTIICIVEQWFDVLTIERTQGYKGLYHVLNGVINPLEGINPDNLTVVPLIARLTFPIKEIIFALNQTPEAEGTCAYIAAKLKDKEDLTISCLARGLPVGSSIGAMDRITVFKALSERRLY